MEAETDKVVDNGKMEGKVRKSTRTFVSLYFWYKDLLFPEFFNLFQGFALGFRN